ncbi:hypothetical protein D1970_20325 [Mesobacillus zeae]|uniref:Uncharacterized protein n=1 Tax=Mesobacillus zeae TaxID=1917180 RepID=A0A398AYE2_9BACI|nr:hypothetical protein [Mesobacillus zeae]RID82074.1 hypothetical protein D1970_20325 [Mesobacillus zeae]
MVRLFFLLTGFGFAVIGGISVIAYLNMLPAGNGVAEYLLFISGRIECYLLPAGILSIWLGIYITGNRDENHFS